MSDLRIEASGELAEAVRQARVLGVVSITEAGKPVARLLPVRRQFDRRKVSAAVERLMRFQATHTLGADLSVADLIDRGRKY